MQNITKNFHSIILGGGASGLMCAPHIAENGSVLVLEGCPEIAGKIKISGGGKCNFTNLGVSAENYISNNPHFVKSALARFKPDDIIKQLQNNNIKYEERQNRQMFAFNAADIVKLLLNNCKQAKVHIRTNEKIISAQKENEIFTILTEHDQYTCRNLIIATGGMSYPQIGASDIGYKIARSFGHKIIEPRPALVGLCADIAQNGFCANLAGVSAPVIIRIDKKKIHGDLLFTHQGISGPAVLNASLYWQKGNSIEIDFLQGQDLSSLLSDAKKQKLSHILSNFIPNRLVKQLLGDLDTNVENLSKKNYQILEERFSKFKFNIKKTAGFNRAEVTAGGVDVSQVSSATMESKLCPKLFFIGEVLDVTGQLGGFNLHWAWASANAVNILEE